MTTEGAGNLAILYNLLVENTGNRPATDIQLQVDRDVLKSAMKPDCSLSTAEITNCFDPHYTIPVLGNGQSTLTAFGKTTDKDDCMWIADSRFPITIKYSDLDERRYRSKVTLFIFDSTGFAGFHYADPR